jgi:ribosome-associated protein
VGLESVEDRPSRSQVKRDAKAASALALRLANTAPDKLKSLELAPHLMHGLLECHQLKRGARQRQVKYVGGLLRQEDWRAIERALEDA